MFGDLYASFIKCFQGENFLYPKLGGHKIIYNGVMSGTIIFQIFFDILEYFIIHQKL